MIQGEGTGSAAPQGEVSMIMIGMSEKEQEASGVGSRIWGEGGVVNEASRANGFISRDLCKRPVALAFTLSGMTRHGRDLGAVA